MGDRDHHFLTENMYIVRKRALLYLTELFTLLLHTLLSEKIADQIENYFLHMYVVTTSK